MAGLSFLPASKDSSALALVPIALDGSLLGKVELAVVFVRCGCVEPNVLNGCISVCLLSISNTITKTDQLDYFTHPP